MAGHLASDGEPLQPTLSEDSSSSEAGMQLPEAEARFRNIFEHAPIGESLVAPDGRWLQVNQALCTIVGYTADELLTKTFQDITHPDDLDADLEFVRRMLAGEIRTYQMEKRYFHKRGHAVWINLSVSLVRDGERQPLYFVSQIEDISARKRGEEALRASEARLAEAQKLAHLGSWEWQIEDGVVTWSDELYRIRGLEPGTAISYPGLVEGVHPEDRARFRQIVSRALESGEPFAFEYRVGRADGSIRWVQGRGEVVTGDRGPVSMYGTAQDITERKQAEEQLAEAEGRYRTLVEQLPLVTYIRPLDLALPNLYASPQVERVTGYPAEQWESDPDLLMRIVHPDDRDRVLAEAQRVRRTGEAFRGEYRYVKPDGQVVWVQDETYPVHDEAGTPVAVQGYLLDITERKRAEAERDRLEAHLRDAQKLEAVGQLAGGIAHEFNNMLLTIIGHTALLIEGVERESPLRSGLEAIAGSAQRAAALTKQLLALGRRQILQSRVVDLNAIVETTAHLLRPLLQPGIELVSELDPSIPTALADPDQIEQVLVNLLLNARDAIAGSGTVTIATSTLRITEPVVGLEPIEAGEYVAVAIADTGRGMDEETQARIFEPFFTTKAIGEGSGLGLSTAYGIVRQGGGALIVESEPGRGTVMTMLLVAHRDPAPAPAEDKASPAGTPAR